MITAERLVVLLNSISKQNTECNCTYYIDNLIKLTTQDSNFCLQVESDFIKNILAWEINPEHNQQYPLTPIFSPGYRDYSLESLLERCFDEKDINLLIELSKNTSLNSEIMARINEILWCYKHPDKKPRNNFAKQAMQHYMISADQQNNRGDMVTRLVRAASME